MIRTLFISSALIFASPSFAQNHDHDHHENHAGHHSDDQDHHAHNDGKANDGAEARVLLSRTPEIDVALRAGGEPVVVEVLGVVCDFCAKAMNKTFSKREEVSAVYVDLDTKTLNLVLASGAAMADQEIDRLVVRAGYKTRAVHRGEQLLRGSDASDPA